MVFGAPRQRRRPGSPVPQTREARRGKTRRRRLLFNAMALGPGLVLAEVVASVFCPLTPSRRLHCLLYRRSRPAPLTARIQRGSRRGDRLPAASHRERRDTRRSRKRIGRREIRMATAKKRTPRPSATPRREMPSAGNATRGVSSALSDRTHAVSAGQTGFLKRAIASDATRGAAGNASGGVRSAWRRRRNGLLDRRRHLAGRCPPRETPRVAFPCALSDRTRAVSAGETGFLKRAIASDANHCVAGNASGGVGSAWRRRATDSSTGGDTSPGDAFPASSSWLTEGSLSHGGTCASMR